MGTMTRDEAVEVLRCAADLVVMRREMRRPVSEATEAVSDTYEGYFDVCEHVRSVGLYPDDTLHGSDDDRIAGMLEAALRLERKP
jgi:hypothetical protein